MSSIANLAVQLSLDAAKFNEGLKSAVGMAKSFAGMIGVGLTVNAFVSTIRELENIGDAAESAGVSVREYMAAVGEMNSEDTQATTQALNKMGKAIAEIAAGGKEKAKELKDLGLDPETLKVQGTYDALRTIAKAYSEAATGTDKLKIAYAAFGKAAVEVMPILEKLAAQSGKIGGRFAGMGPEDIAQAAKTEEMIKDIENFAKNKRDKLALGTGLLGEFFQSLGSVGGVRDMTERWSKETIKANAAEMDKNIARGAERRKQEREAREKPFKDAQDQFKKLNEEIAERNRFAGMSPDMVKATKIVDELRSKVGSGAAAGNDAGRALDAASAAAEKIRQSDMLTTSMANTLNNGLSTLGGWVHMAGQYKDALAIATEHMRRQQQLRAEAIYESARKLSPLMTRDSSSAVSFTNQFKQDSVALDMYQKAGGQMGGNDMLGVLKEISSKTGLMKNAIDALERTMQQTPMIGRAKFS